MNDSNESGFHSAEFDPLHDDVQVDYLELRGKEHIFTGLGKDGKLDDVRDAIRELCSEELLSSEAEFALAENIKRTRLEFIKALQGYTNGQHIDFNSDPALVFRCYDDLLLLKKKGKKGKKMPLIKRNSSLTKLYKRYKNLRDEMIIRNQRLVVFVAKRYRGLGLDFLDLVGEGNRGLFQAVDKYDHKRGSRFSTYAVWWIRHAIRHALTASSRTIRLPQHIVELLYKMRSAEQSYQIRNGQKPPLKILAETLGLTVQQVEHLRHIRKHPSRLDIHIGDDESKTLGSILPDASAQSVDDGLCQEDVLEKTERVKEVILALSGKSKIRDIEIEAYMWVSGLQDGVARTVKQVAKILEDKKSGGRMTSSKVDGYVKKIQRVLSKDPDFLKLLDSENQE